MATDSQFTVVQKQSYSWIHEVFQGTGFPVPLSFIIYSLCSNFSSTVGKIIYSFIALTHPQFLVLYLSILFQFSFLDGALALQLPCWSHDSLLLLILKGGQEWDHMALSKNLVFILIVSRHNRQVWIRQLMRSICLFTKFNLATVWTETLYSPPCKWQKRNNLAKLPPYLLHFVKTEFLFISWH